MTCRDLVVGYGGKPLLPPINFTIFHHQLCAVVGRNGAGKTTWFRTLLGLLPSVGGQLSTCRPDLPMAYIPQRSQLDPIVPLRARDLVAQGLERGRHYLRPLLSRDEQQRVSWALQEMGAADLGRMQFAQLSEGQKQRVLMARLLCSQPELAVLDEPTAAMDAVAERETLQLIDNLRRDYGLAILIVSHHLPVVSLFADQVIFFDRASQNVVAGQPETVFDDPVFRAHYGDEATQALRASREREKTQRVEVHEQDHDHAS